MKYLFIQLWACFVGVGAICYFTYENSVEALKIAENAAKANSAEHGQLLGAMQDLQGQVLGMKMQISELNEQVAAFSMGVNRAARVFGNPPNNSYNAPNQTRNDTAKVFRFTELNPQFAEAAKDTAK